MRDLQRWVCALLGCLVLLGCGSNESEGDYGDPTLLSTPTTDDDIVAWLVSPALVGGLETATPELVIAAYTETKSPLPLNVQIGRLEKDASGLDQTLDLRPARADGAPGREQRFKLEVPLVHGANRLLVRITTLDRTRVRRLVYPIEYRGDAPGASLSVRAPTPTALADAKACRDAAEIVLGVTAAQMVCVSGTVTTAAGSTPREVALGLAGSTGEAVTLDEQGRFETVLALPGDQPSVVEMRISDSEKRTTTARAKVVQDGTPPELAITTRARITSNPSLAVEGTASDAYGLSAIEIQSEEGTVLRVGEGSPWSADVLLETGENVLTVVARDVAGNEARLPLSLSRVRTLWLDAARRDDAQTPIEVDRFDLDELLTADDQKSLSLAEIDLLPAIKQALERIREPERFGVDTSRWGDPERNLQRILSMTPDNADLTGTSMEALLNIARAVGLPAGRVLAELLDIGVTDYVVGPDVTAEVLMRQVVGSHPKVRRDKAGAYVIDVSMYDVFQDMKTLGPRLGPSGAHPGFLEGATEAHVLEPGFLMTLPVRSNLVQYDAVDLSRAAKDFLFLQEGDAVLDFDILGGDFAVVGLADEPTIDLRFVMYEHAGPGRLLAGDTREARADPDRPGFFRGDGQGYGVAPWLFEQVAVEAGYQMYGSSFAAKAYKRQLRYDAGSIKDATVIDWNRGWVSIATAGGIGAPPPPLYAWDLLMEVAQVRLHDNGVAEGKAKMAFSLDDLSIGLKAEQLIEKLRPHLAAQESELSDVLAGDIGRANSRADLFYVTAPRADGALLFRAQGKSDVAYPYAKPGFYADAKLSEKVSTTKATAGVSETAHEKVPAKLGAIYYAQDDTATVYQIEVVARDGLRVGLRVTKVEEKP